MSNQVKIIGGNTSQILRIPKGIPYAFQFEPEFKDGLTQEEIIDILNKKLKLNVYSVNPDFIFKITLVPKLAGNNIIFALDTNDANLDFGIYLGRIAEGETDAGGNFVELVILTQFTFQIIDPSILDSFQTSSLSRLEEIPGSFNDIKVSLKRSNQEPTPDIELWKLIRSTTQAISYNEYEDFLNGVCGTGELPNFGEGKTTDTINRLARSRFLPFTDTDSYRTIKVLTEFFLLVNCAANVTKLKDYSEEIKYSFQKLPEGQPNSLFTLPFYRVLRNRLPDLRVKIKSIGDILDLFVQRQSGKVPPQNPGEPTIDDCYGILRDSLTQPCFLELIWNYWHEEAMLVQALNAISLRFQNVRAAGRTKDPLAALAIAPLRPLNNLMWGYIQDEQHRLTVKRRAHEYDHHYGITLQGKAVPIIEGADSRKHFLEGFHMLLYRCTQFFKQDDDLTVNADAFTLLNALREVHFSLSEGMHNQYGDLPFTARVEMLSQQWLLARPELREFLPSRAMVAYPENWMGPLSAMNTLQGWTGISPDHFNKLALYGEMLLLSIRFGNWMDPDADAVQAANWARFYRSEIQGYIHFYRTVTGVDLTAPHPQTGKIDSRQPSFHLVQRAKASLNGSSNGNGQVKVSSNGKSTVGY